MEINNFLEAIFDQEVPTQERLDYLYDTMDDWMLEGSFEKVNQVFYALKEAYIDKCADDLTIGVGFLTVTHGASEEIRDRSKFAQALKKEAQERYPESELEGMFEGLV